jgi:hypothetical protein
MACRIFLPELCVANRLAGDAPLSDTAQLEDVLWGLYHFLDAHPTETIVASLKVDHGDPNDATLQQTLHDQFTTPPTSDYWVQSETVGVIPSTCYLYQPIPALHSLEHCVLRGTKSSSSAATLSSHSWRQ